MSLLLLYLEYPHLNKMPCFVQDFFTNCNFNKNITGFELRASISSFCCLSFAPGIVF